MKLHGKHILTNLIVYFHFIQHAVSKQLSVNLIVIKIIYDYYKKHE